MLKRSRLNPNVKPVTLAIAAVLLLGSVRMVAAGDVTVVKSGTPDPVNAGGTINYTITVQNTSNPPKTLTGVQLSDTLDAQLTLVNGSVHSSPVGFDDTFTTVGNTPLLVGPTNTLTSPGVFIQHSTDPKGVLGNDVTITDTSVVAAVTNATTTQNGTITLNADGTFLYIPPVGFAGTDTYVYTVRNSTDPTLSDTATLSINVQTPRVWYVNNAGANGDGRSATPFNTLAGAQTASGVNDVIYVFAGTGNYTGGITLKNNQLLIGAGVPLVVNTFTLAAAGSTPTIVNATAGGNGVTLGSGNTVRGFALGNCSASAIAGTSFGTLTISAVSINTTGQALNLSTGAFGASAAINGVTSSGGTNNILFNAVTGTIDLGSGALSGATNDSFKVTGGSATITYNGSIASGSAHSVNIGSITGGTITLGGTISETDTGILLTSNTNGTIKFTNTITANTGTNPAFTATGGGTVEATGANNTLVTTTATALNVANTTIGAGNLNFRSISSNGGSATGIILDTTGTSGSLIVNGDGADVSLGGNSSGGTIANKSGADFSFTTGCGIYLNNTMGVVLRRMTINGTNQNYGIRGTLVNGFTLEYSTVAGTNGTAASLPLPENAGEGSVYFGNVEGTGTSKNGLTGSATVNKCIFSGGRARNFSVINTAGSLNRLTITGCTFGLNQDFFDANQSLALEARQSGTVLNATVTTSTFQGSPGDLGNFTGQTATTMDVIFQGNTCSNTHAKNGIGGGGMTFATQGTMNFHVTGNTFRDADGSAITLQKAFAGTLLSGFFDNNTIGVAGVANSGSKSGNGIFCSYAGGGTASVTITNNQIHQIAGNCHIFADNTGGSYTANFTIQGNTLSTPGVGSFAGIAITNGAPFDPTSPPGDTVNVCAKIGGSTAAEKNTLNLSGGLGIVVGSSGQNGGHTFNLPGYGGGANEANIEAFLSANNAGSFTTDAYADAPATFAAFTGTGTGCPTPASLLFAQGETAAAMRECGCGSSPAAANTLTAAISTPAVANDVQTNDLSAGERAVEPSSIPQPVAQPAALGFVTTELTDAQLKPIVAAAIERWNKTGLSSEQLAAIRATTFDIQPLAGWYLGSSKSGTVTFSRSAAGKGWYISNDPYKDSDYSTPLSSTRLGAAPGELPFGHLDLLTAVMHELGHQLGLKDTYKQGTREGIMYGYLMLGERRLPAMGEAEGAIPNTAAHSPEYLFTPLSIGALPPGKTVTVKFAVTVTNTPPSPYTVANTGSVSGTNITGSPVSSNTVTTTIHVAPQNFPTQTPPSQGDVGFAYANYTFVADGNPAPTYALKAGSGPLPGGLTLDASGLLSGTPTTAGTFSNIIVCATNARGSIDSAPFTITIAPAMTIAPASLLAATAGTATNQTITVSNGTTPYTALTVTAFDAGTTGLTAAALTTNLGAGTVVLNGTPSAAGTATFTVNCTDTVGATLTKNYSLTVNAAITITPATLAGATAGTATNQTITIGNGTTPYTALTVTAFNASTTGLTAAALTPNQGAGTVALSGTPSAAGTATFDVNVTDTAGATATKSYSLTVNPALSISPVSLAAATAGTATNQTITVSNGTTPYTALNVTAFDGGSTGLTAAALTANAGAGTVALSGTPSAAGTATFTVDVTDTAGATASRNYSLTVNAAIAIAPASLAAATAGTATNQTITVSNGTTPYTALTVTSFDAGTTGLAAGALTPNAGTGTVALSGTPSASGTATFTVNVTDTAGAVASKNYSLTVNAAISFSPSALTGATAGTATNQTITVSNGTTPYTALTVTAFNAGTTGLTAAALTPNLGAGTVALSGTPSASGTATFDVNVTDTAGATATKSYTLTVNPVLSIAPASLATALAGSNTNQTITVSNGTTPYTSLTVTAFNGGTTGLTAAALTPNAGAGTVVLNGTPTASGTATFTVDVTDTAGATLSKNYSLTVISITITPSTLPQSTAGTAYSQTLTINNAVLPLNALTVNPFDAGSTGLTAAIFTPDLNAGTLAISGTPSAAGSATFTVNITDGNNDSVSQNFTLTVNPALSISPASLAAATAGTATNQTITVSDGTTPYTALTVTSFNAGTTGLAAGALTPNLGAGTVTLSGTPSAAGTATFTVNVTDTAGATASRNYSLTVNAALAIAPASLAAATAGTATNQTITVSNGTTPYTALTVTGFNAGTTGLAAGALTTNTGAGTVTLSGTPSASGTASFTVNVTDTAGATASQNYSLTVNPAISIAPASLAQATAGTATSQTITVSGGTTPYTAITIANFSAGTTGLTAGALSPNVGAGTVVLNGTATAAGTATFDVNVTDTAGATASKSYSLTVNPALSIAPASLAAATAGTATNQTITVSNGTTPYTALNVTAFDGGTTGLTAAALTPNVGAGTVALSGTPTAAGTATFTVDVTDTAGATASRNYSLTVNAALSIAPATLAAATAGTATNQTITVSNGTTPYTALTVTAFNAGTTGLAAAALTPNAGAGTVTLSGTPSASGTATFTVNVTDTAGATASQNYSLTVNPAISIAPASLAQATAGTATNQTITVSGGTVPYTVLTVVNFSAGTTGLPAAALTPNAGAGNVVLNGTATAAGTVAFDVNVTDTAGATATQSYSLTVNPALSIAPASLAQATAGTATNQTITVSNGTTPYTSLTVTNFSAGTTGLAAAALTPNLGAGTVALSGTPSASGTASFDINVTDTAGATLTKSYSLVVNPVLSIAPASLAAATAGSPTSQIITISNGTSPYTSLTVTNFTAGTTGLAAGALSADAQTGTVTLSGTATAAGTATFDVNVTDTAGATLSQSYSLTVNPALSIAPGTLAEATAGTATNQTITISDGTTPYTSVTVTGFNAGTTGLTAGALTTNAGAGTVTLSGTPGASGSASFTVNVTDTAGATLTQGYTLIVNAALSVTPAVLAEATSGTATSQTLTVNGGTLPYTAVNVSGFSAGTTGLTAADLTPDTGTGTVVLSGTPTAAGTAAFDVNVTDSAGATLTQNFTLTVNPPVTVTPLTLPGGVVYSAYNQTIAITGGTGTATFAVTTGSLPTGVSLNSTTGVLNGSPSATGTFNFTITATDSATATGQQAYTVIITAPTIVLAPATLPAGAIGSPLNAQLSATGGLAPYTFSIASGALPAGVALSPAGVLSGIPTAGGTFNVSITATDSSLGTGPYSSTKAYLLTVGAPTITLAPATLPFTNTGAAYSQTLTASGGTAPYTFAVTAGSLPAGLSLSAAGVISGWATASGLATFTVTATDSSSGSGPFTGSAQMSILVNSAPGLASAPTATPNPAITNQPIQFNASATDADSDPVTYLWDFKDGTTSTLQNPVHSYQVPATYLVSLTVDDGRGGKTTAEVSVEVRTGALAEGDADNDGFADEIEAALNSDPFNSNSRPLNLASPTTSQAITNTMMTIRLDFTRTNNDYIFLRGRIPFTAAAPAGTSMIVDIGGVVKTITLDSTGRAQEDEVKRAVLQIRRTGSKRNFLLLLTRGAFATALVDEKLTASQVKGAERKVNVTIILMGVVYKATVSQSYFADSKHGRTTTRRP
ncbi:MAG TPA: putative Ig domain-containing protein [Planctomycetota bacterium]|nr:putative Ig domain-containing protein [Planctomycetota bacterium]